MQRCGAAMQGRLGTVLAQVQPSVLAAAACSDGFLGGIQQVTMYLVQATRSAAWVKQPNSTR